MISKPKTMNLSKAKGKAWSMKRTPTCQYCHKKFFIANWRIGTAKYCSFQCSNKGRTTEKSYHKERTCEGCQVKFKPTQWYQKFCSRPCFTKSVRKRQDRVCDNCSKIFRQTRIAQKFCSRACSKPHLLKRHGENERKPKNNYLDDLWSELIKLIAKNKCEVCGKESGLNSHHIFSRSNFRLRWVIENGVSLCVSHHIFGNFSAHKSPIEFAEWLKEKRGVAWYDDLREKNRSIEKLTPDDKLMLRKNLYEKIKTLKQENITTT